MSEGFPSPAGHGEGDADDGLHAMMIQATADIGAITADPVRLRRAQRRHRLAEGGAVAGVLSVALVATAIAFHSGPGKTSGATTTTPPSRTLTTARPTPRALPDPVTPIAVSVYDSDDGSEGLGTAGRLLTGGPGWQTNQYCQDYATRGGVLKSTGLIFDLGAPTRITGATVDIGIPGADLELWAADPSVTAWPAVRHQPPAGFTKVASSPAAHTGGTTVFTFADVTTRYVLVWFNGRLPVTPNPNRAILCAHSDGNLYGDSITAVRFSRG